MDSNGSELAQDPREGEDGGRGVGVTVDQGLQPVQRAPGLLAERADERLRRGFDTDDVRSVLVPKPAHLTEDASEEYGAHRPLECDRGEVRSSAGIEVGRGACDVVRGEGCCQSGARGDSTRGAAFHCGRAHRCESVESTSDPLGLQVLDEVGPIVSLHVGKRFLMRTTDGPGRSTPFEDLGGHGASTWGAGGRIDPVASGEQDAGL